jgi:hypothetical protein
MSTPSNLVRGSLVVQNLPELFCFQDARELIQSLPSLLGVEIPDSISNVIVSNTQPTDSQTAALWIRLANSGSFLGLYVFSQGQWRPILPVNTDTTLQIFWFSSDTGDVPAGFTKIESGTPGLPVAVKTALIAQYVTSGSVDLYFAAIFTGF